MEMRLERANCSWCNICKAFNTVVTTYFTYTHSFIFKTTTYMVSTITIPMHMEAEG